MSKQDDEDTENENATLDLLESSAKQELADVREGENSRRYGRLILAAMAALPWVGSFLAAAAAFHAEVEQGKINDLHAQWLAEHEQKLGDLHDALASVAGRLDEFGAEIDARLVNDGYLSLVRRGFRVWDRAETHEKRRLVEKTLANAAATRLSPDDMVRMFLDWIDGYDELHFKVIAAIYRQPGISRAEIWRKIHGTIPREDSAEADLFKLLIRDLSTGGVVRQQRATTPNGDFVKKKGRRGSSGVMKSAFDPLEPYVLTEMGSQFVHYAMTELVSRLGAES